MTTMPTLTLAHLKNHGASEQQCELFACTFGEAAELTEQNAIRAADVGIVIVLLATALLAPYWWDQYWQITRPIWDSYERNQHIDMIEYHRACALAFFRLYLAQQQGAVEMPL